MFCHKKYLLFLVTLFVACKVNSSITNKKDKIKVLMPCNQELGFAKLFLNALSDDKYVLYIIPYDIGPRDYFSDTLNKTNRDEVIFKGKRTIFNRSTLLLKGEYKTKFNQEDEEYILKLCADSISFSEYNQTLNIGYREKVRRDFNERPLLDRDSLNIEQYKLRYHLISNQTNLEHGKFVKLQDSLIRSAWHNE